MKRKKKEKLGWWIALAVIAFFILWQIWGRGSDIDAAINAHEQRLNAIERAFIQAHPEYAQRQTPPPTIK